MPQRGLYKLDLKKLREKRSRKWTFSNNIANKKIESKIDLIDGLKAHQKISSSNNLLVQNSLKKQDDQMAHKLNERRRRSFNKSLSKMEGVTLVKHMRTASHYLDNTRVSSLDNLVQDEPNFEENRSKIVSKEPAGNHGYGELELK